MANIKRGKSIEEKVEYEVKTFLCANNIKNFAKTESINTEIDSALKKANSKSGGTGGNYPDVKVMVKLPNTDDLPVMIEVKGNKGRLVKLDVDGNVQNYNEKGQPDYKKISKYAVNGAVHYAEAIINHTYSFKEVLAVGVNGYEDENDKIRLEYGVYYISRDNLLAPKKVGDYTDLSFLAEKHLAKLQEVLKNINLTEEEIEKQSRDIENRIETSLQQLNQNMHDNLNIKAESRVQLVCGMIMAALGVENKIKPLEVAELKGETGKNSNDGKIILDKVKDFLTEKKLPNEKLSTMEDIFSSILLDKNYYTPKNGESPLKTVYMSIKDDVLPYFLSESHLDFTGRLFNVLNSWIPIRPGDDKNDVVLTPRYVTELMAKLCEVNKDSYVWDYAAGSGGFLISAMKLMIDDVKKTVQSEAERERKICHIRSYQLLGVEIRPDIYMLAVLNMILMKDGSSHILNKDSLKDYDGKYEQQIEDEGEKDFPANVFLLNPPYSAEGKGFIFVEKALSKMKTGKAAILIFETAGSGHGLPYTKRILENNTLVASIKMSPKLFIGKAGVQTAIYLFEVGKKHDVNKLVKFIDFSEDGYTRLARKKSRINVNLRDTDNAKERYDELVKVVLGHKRTTHYLDDLVIEDTISLDGDDWTYAQHKKINTIPTQADFKKTVADYMSWEISTLLKNDDSDADSLGK